MKKIVGTSEQRHNRRSLVTIAANTLLRAARLLEVLNCRQLSLFMNPPIPRRHFVAAIFAIFLVGLSLTSHAADLSAEDKEFLAKDEKVRAALATDNLENARKAAADLGEEGSAINKSDKIVTARAEFSKLSEHAIKLASGQKGYYVVNCPMVQKDWVQPAGQISNPYAGQSMPTCGAIKREALAK